MPDLLHMPVIDLIMINYLCRIVSIVMQHELGSVTFWRHIVCIPHFCPPKQGGKTAEKSLDLEEKSNIYISILKETANIFLWLLTENVLQWT